MRLFFTKTGTVSRLTNDQGTTAKEAYASVGSHSGALMSAQPADTMLSEGNPSKSSVWFCDPDTDIKDADKLTVDGVAYIVKGVSKTEGIGMTISYKKALIERLNS